MSFAVERTATDEGICVAVAGEVDVETAPRLRDALLAALESGEPVVVDLGAVTFFDSGGLAVLVAAYQRAATVDQSVQLRHVPARVGKIMAITGLDGLFGLEPARDHLD